jgi:hypothetical protein
MNTPTPYDDLTKGKPVYHGKELVGYTVDDPNSIDGKRFYPLEHLNEIINEKIIASNKKNHNTIDTIGSGGSRKRARRNSKKHKRVRHSRRKQTRRHRHSRRR